MSLGFSVDMDLTKYLIVGAGVSGLSVAEYLLSRNKQFRIMDDRDLPPNAAKIKAILSESQICFGRIDRQWLRDADVVVLSPGVSPDTPEIKQSVRDDVELLGDIELFAREVEKPYIAITGSNGKSTVTTLVTEILKSQGIRARACANIGEPALSLLDDESIDIYVLELSSFQLETCSSLSPQAAAVLNVSDDHLDRHSSIEEYTRIKKSIYKQAKFKIVPRAQDGIELSKDSDHVISFGSDTPEETSFGIRQDENSRWLVKGKQKLIDAKDIPLLGLTGELNVLAAWALSESFIHDPDKVRETIRTFKGLPHRCEVVVEQNGMQWINDSKGTNVGATVSAIASINRPIILILGGVHKGGSIDLLLQAVQTRVKLVIVFGRDKQVFIDALKDVVQIVEQSSLNECVEFAHQMAEPGDAVLFSPACASFDMFSNYIERGQVFTSAVKQFVSGESHGGD